MINTFAKESGAKNHTLLGGPYLSGLYSTIPQARMGYWDIHSEPMRARGIIVLVKSN